jgi:hypothetical protein
MLDTPDSPARKRGSLGGHVAAVLGMTRKLGLGRLLPHRPNWLAKLAMAMIVARVVEPAPKRATAQLGEQTAAHSLGAVLELGKVDEDELLPGARSLAGSAAQDRDRAGPPSPQERLSGALRSDLELFRGSPLSAGALRL